MRITRQPENYLYNETPYQLPGPAPVLAPQGSGGMPGPHVPSGLPPARGGHDGHGGSGGPGGSGGSDGKSPPEWLLYVVWRQKWVIAATMIVAAVAAAFYLARATPLYTSTAKVAIRPLSVNVGPNNNAGAGNADTTSPNYLNAEKETITGTGVLSIAATLQDVLQTELMKNTSDPIETLRSVVSADVDKTSDRIAVSASCPVPEDAAAIANGVVKAYQLYQTRSSTDQSSSIDRQLDTLRDEQKAIAERIEQQSKQLQEMETQYGVLSHQDDRSNIVFRRLQALSEALTAAQAQESDDKMAADEATRAYGGAATRPATGAATPASALDDDLPTTTAQDLAVLKAEMVQTQTQLQELEQHYLPEHPAITSRRRMLASLRRRYVAAVQRRAVASTNRVADLQARYDDEQKRAVEVDAHAAEYQRVKDDQNMERAKRDALATQIRNIELSRALGELKVDLKEPAKVALRPSFPNRTKTMAVALAVGLTLGLLLACMREWVDDRFRSAGEIKSSLGMPLLAVIPQSTTKRSPSVSGQRILLDPGSDTAEAYRSLRSAVLYSAPEGQMRTLLVTSPTSGDGKTTLVSNLAIAMAQGGRKVLIVDADLRNPSQHDIFGVKNNTGLSALLAGRCSLETAVQRSHVQNLEILPCGPTPANPAEILNSREFGETLETLADKYDCVVLDSPPVEAVADARIIAASCDATLIVLKAQTAHRRTTEHTRDALTSVGARVLGLVVNDLPRRTSGGYGSRNAASRRYVPGLTNVAEPEALQAKGK